MQYNIKDIKILIVDDDKALCELFGEVLKEKYLHVKKAYSVADAVNEIMLDTWDIVITDLRLGDGTGMDVLKAAKEKDRYCEVIMITGYGTLENASEAVKLGVISYLTKPVDLFEFRHIVDRAVATRMFHIRSLSILNNVDKNGNSDIIYSHFSKLHSMYVFVSRLLIGMDVPDILRLLFNEVAKFVKPLFITLGIDYLEFKELYSFSDEIALSKEFLANIFFSKDIAGSIKDFSPDDINSGIIPVNIVNNGYKNTDKKFSNYVFPLNILGDNIGFVILSYENNFNLLSEDEQYFQIIYSLATSALQHIYTNMFAKRQAKTDGLTGIDNHRSFHENLDRILSIAKRKKRPFSLIMIDLDDFKKINDKYGHQAGDLVLKDFSLLVKSIKRCEDILCRYGGEEFVIILPDTNCDGAFILASRIKDVLQERIVNFVDKNITYTISMGIAEFNLKESKDELIARADMALYMAKEKGKNTIVIDKQE